MREELKEFARRQYREGLHLIPEYMHGAVERYVEHGIMPGSFLEAVLANDLKGAAGSADHWNGKLLKQYAQFVMWHMPSAAQGSYERVQAWSASHGLSGTDKDNHVEAD